MTGDYESGLSGLRKQYALDLSQRVDEIELALAEDDGARAAAIAHGLAGSAHVLGLHELGDAASSVGSAALEAPEHRDEAVRGLHSALATVEDSLHRVSRRQRLNHDLRSPLTAVLGYADLLRDHDLDPSARAMVEGILEAGEAILRLLDEESAEFDAVALSGLAAPAGSGDADEPTVSLLDVLIVDDDVVVRDVMVATLQTMEGVSARAVSTLAEADTALQERPPGLLIVDLNLGGTDGARFLQEARHRCPATFVAVLTGDDPSSRRDELHRLGADAVVRKGPPEALRLLVVAARAGPGL
jgi:CheY-like chemotaxis protein